MLFNNYSYKMLFFKMLFLIFCHLLLQLWMFILNMGKVNDNNNEVCKPNLQIAVHALIFSTLCSVWCQRIFLKWNSQSGEGEGGLKGKGASSLFQTEDELRSPHRAVLSLVGSKKCEYSTSCSDHWLNTSYQTAH